MRPRDVVALATDFDRTLTGPDLAPTPAALRQLRRARAEGRKVIVVSGRGAAFLQEAVADAADALVAENGCVVVVDGVTRSIAPSFSDVRQALAALGLPLETGEFLVSAGVEHEGRLRAALDAAGMEADLVRNLDRVMVLPRGVDKAAGLLAALRALGVPPDRCAAVGDGENDVAMLRAVGLRLAVGNAVPELKAEAHLVLDGYGGDAVASWIERSWLAREVAP